MVAADASSRPSLLWRTVVLILSLFQRKKNHEEHAKILVERGFETAYVLSFVLTLAFAIADAAASAVPATVLSHNTIAGVAVFTVGLILVSLVMLDIVTYRPRIFAKCTGPAEEFFDDLAQLSPTLRDQVATVSGAKPRTWKQVKELEQGLLAESRQFLLIDRLRFRVTARMMVRLLSLIASLALVGYGLAAMTSVPVLAQLGAATEPPLVEYAYFTIITFFTIGFGDTRPAHHAAGYAYLVLIVLCFVSVFYFVLTEIVASHGEFRFNIRAAAENFVLERSQL